MRVLFTSGGTEEPIDSVRRITNFSTGRTGATLARYFADWGTQVTLLRAEGALSPPAGASLSGFSIREATYLSYAELRERLQGFLEGEHWDAVVHLAAVSDYTVDAIEVDGSSFHVDCGMKIESGRDVVLHLKPTARILDSLKEWSCNPELRVVAFKLTSGTSEKDADSRVRDVFARSAVDYVVHNDLANIGDEEHICTLWGFQGILEQSKTKKELARMLYTILAGEML